MASASSVLKRTLKVRLLSQHKRERGGGNTSPLFAYQVINIFLRVANETI